LTRSGHGRCEGLGPRISTRFRHGDTYEVRTAWNRRVFVHRAPTRRSVKRAVHLGLRRFRGGHFARVSPIERMFWSWLPILPAPPVSTRCDSTTHSPISDLINMYQYILRLYSRVFSWRGVFRRVGRAHTKGIVFTQHLWCG